ncbi:hypothetical protein DRO66_04935 [Candidatus Bathyarchaeota archaeon]|nr:MAG: hypothetical protein DRO66_04935 [Candidatus Bathyarchaeota archaeon]
MKQIALLLSVVLMFTASCEKMPQKELVQVDLSFSGESAISSAIVYNDEGVLMDLGTIPLGSSRSFSIDEGESYKFLLITNDPKEGERQKVNIHLSFSGLFRKINFSPSIIDGRLVVEEVVTARKY